MPTPNPRYASVRRHATRGWKAVRMPYWIAEHSLGLAAQPRLALLCSKPTAPQVVANYTRGLTLFGRSHARKAIFEWRSFPLRGVITAETAKIPKSVRAVRRRTELSVKFDTDFEEIIYSCQRDPKNWMWLTPALIDVYREVHQLGFVSTAAVYRDSRLVGGLWGISVGRVFGGMSMFHKEDNAGSLALAALAGEVLADGRWTVVDCGWINPHFRMYGATEIPQDKFCELVWQTIR